MNGNKLKSMREKQGLLQKQLGDNLGISASTIGMYEQNRIEPDNETLKKIANYFEVSTDYLLDNENVKYRNEMELIEKNVLIDTSFIKCNEDLNDGELKMLLNFINNKDFIKNAK